VTERIMRDERLTFTLLPVRYRDNPKWLSASVAQNQPYCCPSAASAQARGLWLEEYGWKLRREPWPKSPFVLRDAVNAYGQGEPVDAILALYAAEGGDGTPLHPGLMRYLRHALATYENVHLELAEDFPHLQHTDEWDATIYQGDIVRAWAVYLHDGAGTREIRRLRLRGCRPDDPNAKAGAAVAAYVAGHGQPPGDTAPVTRIRVLEVGCDRGDIAVMFDGDLAAAQALFEEHALPRLRTVVQGGGYKAGRDCASCRYLGGCERLPRANGLLGVPSNGVATRSVSAATLASWLLCPSQHFMRDLAYLPLDHQSSHSDAQNRGIWVHQWLDAAHRRGISCTLDDLPDLVNAQPTDESGDVIGLGPLEPHEYAVALPYLRQHVQQCPLQFDHVEGPLHVERLLRVYDADADTVIAAKPDFTFTTGGRPVWREVKTHLVPGSEDPHHVIDASLAAALFLAWLGSDAADPRLHSDLRDWVPPPLDTATPGVLEWEVLTPTTSYVVFLDAADEALLLHARQRLAEIATQWHNDVTFAAKPGPRCEYCTVAKWCPSAGQTPVPPAGPEAQPGATPVDMRTGAAADPDLETDLNDWDDDNPPF
jgi:hypothetical protein